MNLAEFEIKSECLDIEMEIFGTVTLTVRYIVWNRADGSQRIRIQEVTVFDQSIGDVRIMTLEDTLIDLLSSTQPDEE